jgi:hypothetical protein
MLSLYNSCVMGYPFGVSLRDDSTKVWANTDTLQWKRDHIQASTTPGISPHIHDEGRWPFADPIPPGILAWIGTVGYGNNDGGGVPRMPSTVMLTDMSDIHDPDPRPMPGSPLVTDGTFYTYRKLQRSGTIDSVDYRGAFDPDLPMSQQWTANWTNFHPCAEPYHAGVDDIFEPKTMTRTLLGQNYPNPFSPATNIRFTVPKDGHISLKLHNVLGQEVATLVDEDKTAGTYEVTFSTDRLAPGAYFYTLKGRGFTETRKMILTQ